MRHALTKRFFSRERLIALVVSLTLGITAFIIGLRWIERTIAFHPEPYRPGQPWLKPSGAIDVWFTTADGQRLHGWFFSAASKPSTATVIYFHGNGGNINNVGWIGERLSTRGFDSLIFDYRGYGRSEGELKDEQGLYADADAAYQYLVKERGVLATRIVLYGQSLGTAAAADLAMRNKCGALILESGPSSASNMARTALPWLPTQLHFLAKNRFDSALKLASVECPVLITHGDPDETIPTENSRILFEAAREPKKLIVFPGAGHNVFGSGGDKYLDTVALFITDSLKN
jgi:fermentation-respiration switch protein FrsA (DUF1100 family)